VSASYISDEGPHKGKIKGGKALRSNVIARRRTKQESRPKKRGGGKNCKDRKKNPVRSTHNIIITSGIPLCIYIIITNDARDIIERERDYIQGHLNRRKVHFTILIFFFLFVKIVVRYITSTHIWQGIPNNVCCC
jgi:hypothetical protein